MAGEVGFLLLFWHEFNTVIMKIGWIMCLLLSPILLLSQNEGAVFVYLENNVKSVAKFKKEVYFYEYQQGVIIETSYFRSKLERFYYYSEVNRIDSIISKSYEMDTVFCDKITFSYNQLNQLVKKQRGTNILEEIIYVDSFSYNLNNQIDTLFEISNKVEEILGTMKVDSLLLQATYIYKYDKEARLIEKKRLPSLSKRKTVYSYDVFGNLIKEVECLANRGVTCLARLNERYVQTTYFYNKHRLLTRKNTLFFTQEENRRRKNKYRIRMKMKYKYY